MNDANGILKNLLILSPKSEGTTSKLFIKFLYVLNCIIISLWLAASAGYPFPSISFNFESLLKLFVSYYIIVPVFLFFCVEYLTKNLIELTALLLSKTLVSLIGRIVDKKKKSPEAETHEENQTNADNSFENLKFRLPKLKKRLSEVKGNYLLEKYITCLFATTIFLYYTVIRQHFPNLEYSIVGLILINLLVFNIMKMSAAKHMAPEIESIADEIKMIELQIKNIEKKLSLQ